MLWTEKPEVGVTMEMGERKYELRNTSCPLEIVQIGTESPGPLPAASARHSRVRACLSRPAGLVRA